MSISADLEPVRPSPTAASKEASKETPKRSQKNVDLTPLAKDAIHSAHAPPAAAAPMVKLNSAYFEREYSGPFTFTTEEGDSPKEISANLRKICQFLEQKSTLGFSRHMRNYYPVLIDDDQMAWQELPKKLNEKNKREHENCVRAILIKIEHALSSGHNEFTGDNYDRIQTVNSLFIMIEDNLPTKRTLKENKSIRELWRMTHLARAMPYTEMRVLRKLSAAMKTILDAFINHQLQQIAFLKKDGHLKEVNPGVAPEWPDHKRDRILQSIYKDNLDDLTLNDMILTSPSACLATLPAKQGILPLHTFFTSLKDLSDKCLKELNQLGNSSPVKPPALKNYIANLKDKDQKKKCKQFLKEEAYLQLIQCALGEQYRQWQAAKEKLPFALAELAKRGCWLIRIQGHSSYGIERHESTLKQKDGPSLGYHALETMIQNIAKVIGDIGNRPSKITV